MSSFILEQRILSLKAQGEIAEPQTWISSYTVTNTNKKGEKGKTYTYFRVMKAWKTKDGQQKARVFKYLGKEGSKAHREAQRAIARRNEIQRLERKLQQLKHSPKLVRGDQKPSTTSHLTFDPQTILNQLTQLQAEIKQLRQENQQLWAYLRDN